MCRLAAYLGAPISLQHFLQQPPHSLYEQSWAPRELEYAHVNADGFGVGWYNIKTGPARYRNTLPIWQDRNLVDLGRVLESGLWLGNVRSATHGMGISVENTQPFLRDDFLYIHNGYVSDFARLKPKLLRLFDEQTISTIQGDTDSEYLISGLHQFQMRQPDSPVETHIQQLCALLESTLEAKQKALLTCIFSDGIQLFALRHGINNTAPTLYFSTDNENFPDGQIIASEPLDDSDYWHSIPEGHLLILDQDSPPELKPLWN